MNGRQYVLVYRGDARSFLSWLRSWDPMRDNPDLDACVARHPAGKRIGRG